MVTGAVVLAADLYLHRRAERSAGLNYRGYRGPVVGRKQAGEVRIVALGGSTVFGYGGPWHEAFPALLEGMLNQRDPGRKWTAINLGFNAEGVYALLPTIEDFARLDFDLAIFYVGYNDMMGDGGPNLALMRRRSGVFRLTGYYPILPSFLKERALMLRYGDLETGVPGDAARAGRAGRVPSDAGGACVGAGARNDESHRGHGRSSDRPLARRDRCRPRPAARPVARARGCSSATPCTGPCATCWLGGNV